MVWAIKETFADIQGCKLGGNNYITRFMDTIFLFSFYRIFVWNDMGIFRMGTVWNYGYFECNKFSLYRTDCYMFLKFDLKGQRKYLLKQH